MIATVSQPSRRWLLAAASTAVALTGAAPPAAPNPDAGLIALCAAYVAKWREYVAVGSHTDHMLLSDPEWRRCHIIACAMVPGLHAMEAEIAAVPARTIPGLIAKAEVARQHLSGNADAGEGPTDEQNNLEWSLVGDMLDVLRRAAA